MIVKRTKTDADTVLNNAETLFRQKGYGNTTMSEIGAKSGLLKGSLYHHFPSKEEICISIIRRVAYSFRETILCHAYDAELTKSEQLNFLMTETQNYLLNKKGCLMAHLGLETAFYNSELSELVQHFFSDWTAAIAHILEAKYGEEKSIQLAQDTVAKVEGAVVYLTICHNPAPLKRITIEAMNLLKA